MNTIPLIPLRQTPEASNEGYCEPRNWVTSLSEEELHKQEKLRKLAYNALLESHGVTEYLNFGYWYSSSTATSWDTIGKRYLLSSKLFQTASPEDRDVMTATWWGAPSWVYTTQHSEDGLWDEEIPRHVIKMDETDKMVASGALGFSMIHSAYRELRDYVKTLDYSLFDASVLVAGAALFERSRRNSNKKGSYRSTTALEGIQATTYTGGDINGDFRTERVFGPAGPIGTSVSMHKNHVYMPELAHERVGAYHSIEPAIVGALVRHLVERTGVKPAELHRSLMGLLQSAHINSGGDFGDYGHDDGGYEAWQLQYALQNDGYAADEPERQLVATVVMPQTNYYFRVISLPQAVQFRNTDGEDEKTYQTMTIPNDEIIDYIVTMIRGGGGRTSPGAMIKVIDALVEK